MIPEVAMGLVGGWRTMRIGGALATSPAAQWCHVPQSFIMIVGTLIGQMLIFLWARDGVGMTKARSCSGGRLVPRGPVVRCSSGRWGRGQAACLLIRSQAAATSPDQAHPGGIFNVRLRAWWTSRAGADRTRPGPRGRPQDLDRRLERRPQALREEEDRLRDPRPLTISTAN